MTIGLRLSALSVALLLLPATLTAQRAGAALPGRFERQVETQSEVRGLSRAEARAWIGSVGRVNAILSANPAVSGPPPGMCTRLYSYVSDELVGDRAADRVQVLLPVRYDERGCSEITGSGVSVALNDPLGLLRPDGAVNPAYSHDGEGPMLILPRIGVGPGGRAVYRVGSEKAVILTRGSEPLIVPVSVERFLSYQIAEAERALAEVGKVSTEPLIDVERWLREDRPRMVAENEATLRKMAEHVSAEEIAKMRRSFAEVLAMTEAALRGAEARQPDRGAVKAGAQGAAGTRAAQLRAALAGLSTVERRAPACEDLRRRPTGLGACTDRNRWVSLNPRYFDRSLPASAVQLIVVSTPAGMHNMEDRRRAELRWRVFDTMDYAALAEVLH